MIPLPVNSKVTGVAIVCATTGLGPAVPVTVSGGIVKIYVPACCAIPVTVEGGVCVASPSEFGLLPAGAAGGDAGDGAGANITGPTGV